MKPDECPSCSVFASMICLNYRELCPNFHCGCTWLWSWAGELDLSLHAAYLDCPGTEKSPKGSVAAPLAPALAAAQPVLAWLPAVMEKDTVGIVSYWAECIALQL